MKKKPHLTKKDTEMFYRYLKKAKVYFEYGSGGSTYQASIRDNIKKIYSVESDPMWFNELRKNITTSKFCDLYNEMDTQPKTWGRPGKKANNLQKINYSNHMKNLNKKEQQSIDLVLIDGRFRVACCLKCYDIVKILV